ncbi:MAG: nitrilase-related carbon-nitrogen hydrolase, partial [Halobacteriota archaeon]
MQEGVDRGADALLIPEFCTGAAAVWSTSPPGKALSWFTEFAKEHEVYVAPASYIRDQRGDKYNAVVLIDPAGHIMGFSGKKHLYYTDCNLGNAKRHME